MTEPRYNTSMSTLLLTHPACLDHLTPPGHPERPDRLRAIEQALEDERFHMLAREQAPRAPLEIVARLSAKLYLPWAEKPAEQVAESYRYLTRRPAGDTRAGRRVR